MSADDSRSTVEAVREARPSGGADPACGPASDEPVTTLRSASLDARLLPGRTCPLASVFLDAGEEKLLTEDVLYWALSPGGWWDALGDAVPVPDPLRTG